MSNRAISEVFLIWQKTHNHGELSYDGLWVIGADFTIPGDLSLSDTQVNELLYADDGAETAT